MRWIGKVARISGNRFWRNQRGAIDDLLQRGLMVVAVLGIAGAILAYYTEIGNWFSQKLTKFTQTY